jgi:flagellar biosynthesis/type III secretory pathway M-ring protein FliF/YscJ
MFSGNYFEILKQILKSWQVITVTVVLILYVSLVSYVARSYHRKKIKKVKIKKKKKIQPEVIEDEPEESRRGSRYNEELGLEEE